jgi:hypothetical protein
MINYKLEDLFFEKVYSNDITVPFKYVFFSLKKQKVILPSDKDRRGVLKFNANTAQLVLNQLVTNSLSGLTLNENPNQEVSIQNSRYPQKIRKFFRKATVPVLACIPSVWSLTLQNDNTGKHILFTFFNGFALIMSNNAKLFLFIAIIKGQRIEKN